MKRQVEFSQIYRLINPGCVALVTVGDGERDNVFSVAWNSPLRKEPPMLSILVGKRHYSYSFIDETGAFAVHVPPASLARAVLDCGTSSGRDVADKFRQFGLTRRPNPHHAAPYIEEALASLACRVSHVVDMGTSVLFIAQVLGAEADDVHFREGAWRFDRGLELLYHLGGSRFAVADRDVDVSHGT